MPRKDDEFRTIPEFEEYEINRSGQVRRKARLLKPYMNSVVLSRKGKGVTKIYQGFIRDLVAEIWPETSET